MPFGKPWAEGRATWRRGALSALPLVALGLFACSGSTSNETEALSPAETVAAETEAPHTPATTAPHASTPGERKAQAAIDSALERIARLRKLAPRGPVHGEVLDAADLVRHVKDSLDSKVPPRALQGTSELLWALGTVPDGFDYQESALVMMRDELAGLYDPENKAMYLRRDLGEDAMHATLAHELVHALQDQHYGLNRMTEWRDDATDELSALSALAEGDATSAMLDDMLQESGKLAFELPSELLEGQMRLLGGATENAERVPPILKRSLIAPYADGISFVHALRRQGGWQAVDRAWQKLPVTTEQLLHPEKYLAGEPALVVAVPPPPTAATPSKPTAPPSAAATTPGNTAAKNAAPPSTSAPNGTATAAPSPWQVAFHDVWGEQSLRLLLEEWMPMKSAAESASGWGGDRIAVYRSAAQGAVAWHLLADDDASAERMLRAFARGVHAADWSAEPSALPSVSRERAQELTKSGSTCRVRPGRGPFLVLKRGVQIMVVAGPYAQAAPTTIPAPASDCAAALRWAELIAKSASPSEPNGASAKPNAAAEPSSAPAKPPASSTGN
jgi:hypothetical protein